MDFNAPDPVTSIMMTYYFIFIVQHSKDSSNISENLSLVQDLRNIIVSTVNDSFLPLAKSYQPLQVCHVYRQVFLLESQNIQQMVDRL